MKMEDYDSLDCLACPESVGILKNMAYTDFPNLTNVNVSLHEVFDKTCGELNQRTSCYWPISWTSSKKYLWAGVLFKKNNVLSVFQSKKS